MLKFAFDFVIVLNIYSDPYFYNVLLECFSTRDN